MKSSIILEVSGDYALFSRPEMKVERVSHDVITPSAARGILGPLLETSDPLNRSIYENEAFLNEQRLSPVAADSTCPQKPSAEGDPPCQT